MPPRTQKQLTWKCRNCKFTLIGNDKDEFKEKGFNHYLTRHHLVDENRGWFDTHTLNYYEIS